MRERTSIMIMEIDSRERRDVSEIIIEHHHVKRGRESIFIPADWNESIETSSRALLCGNNSPSAKAAHTHQLAMPPIHSPFVIRLKSKRFL